MTQQGDVWGFDLEPGHKSWRLCLLVLAVVLGPSLWFDWRWDDFPLIVNAPPGQSHSLILDLRYIDDPIRDDRVEITDIVKLDWFY